MRIITYELSDEVVLEIGKFAILWNEFEKNFFKYEFKPSKLKSVLQNIVIDQNLLKEFRDDLGLQYCYYNNIDKFIKDFFYTNNSNHNPNKQDKDYICYFLNDTGTYVDKLYGCILIIYRYRNNLMHGMKNVEGLEQQLQVFKIINGLLESIKKKIRS